MGSRDIILSVICRYLVVRSAIGDGAETNDRIPAGGGLKNYGVFRFVIDGRVVARDHDWPKIRVQRALGPVKDDGVIVS